MTLPALGTNGHELSWTGNSDPANGPIVLPLNVSALITGLGAVYQRNDLVAQCVPMTDDLAFTGELGSQKCLTQVGNWAEQLRTAKIQPVVTVTFPNNALPPENFPGLLAEVADAVPGIIWEIGNEWEAEQGGPTIARAQAYVTLFAATLSALKAADPSCKVCPNPVANVNPSGWGWWWTKYCFQSGLARVPYDLLTFHAYSYPDSLPPSSTNIYLDVAAFISQTGAWGNTKPYAVTECGFEWGATGMSPALQATYVTEMLEQFVLYGLEFVCVYELLDNLPGYGPPNPATDETFGFVAVSGTQQSPVFTPHPVYGAVQSLYAAPCPAPTDKANYQAALTHITNRAQAMQQEVNAANAWLAANSHLSGIAEVKSLVAWMGNEITINENFVKNAPTP